MFEIDRYSRDPIYEQIIDYIKQQIEQGQLHPDQVLPSVRVLSQKLNVNPNTLQKAYTALEKEGLCFTVAGNGRYITSEAKEILLRRKKRQIVEIEKLTIELKQAGITLEEIIQTVKDGYMGEKL
jgi:GntR family transcriptional regulator